jgi:hypothetical protein
MEIKNVERIQQMIKNHRAAVTPPEREIPVGAGNLSDDLSKVMSNDIIGKGEETNLRKGRKDKSSP